jgi:DNA modification methylase
MPRDGIEPPHETWHLQQGDCVEVMTQWAAEGIQVDAVICDPPFHLQSVVKRFGKAGAAPAQHGKDGAAGRLSKGFMGHAWDGAEDGRLPVAFDPATWRAALALLKPGGRLVAFGGTRKWHRMACAIEDAGFEIEDTIVWAFGQGLVLRRSRLNPGWSPIVVARAPGPVLDLGIEACRVEGAERPMRERADTATVNAAYSGRMDGSLMGGSRAAGTTTVPRWPKNLIHDGSPEVMDLLPDSPGKLAAARRDGTPKSNRGVYDTIKHAGHTDGQPRDNGRTGEASADRRYTDHGGTNFAAKPGMRRFDTGSAARFFNACPWDETEDDLNMIYHGKVTNADKVYQCTVCDIPIGNAEMKAHRHDMEDWRHVVAHPTQKPVKLLRHLCRLIAKPGEIVLDPFAGTSTTLRAAVLEGMDAMGVEQSAEYCEASRFRMNR